jgi:hypothetical protein
MRRARFFTTCKRHVLQVSARCDLKPPAVSARSSKLFHSTNPSINYTIQTYPCLSQELSPKMSSPPPDAAMLLSRLSYRPDHIFESLIPSVSPPEAPQESSFTDNLGADRVSSFGLLELLPPELLSSILRMLDVQSIVRLSCTSVSGNLIVRSHQPYRDLLALAPEALSALSRTWLLNVYSAPEIHAALRAERCFICSQYGAFLFLPTCERCCWDCLYSSPLTRLITPRQIMEYFGLNTEQVEQLTTLRVTAGKYLSTNEPDPRGQKVIAVKAARDVGLPMPGPLEEMDDEEASDFLDEQRLITGYHILDADAEEPPGDRDPLRVPSRGDMLPDHHFGMGAVPFPSVSEPGKREDGLWCKGCDITYFRYLSGLVPWIVQAALVPAGCKSDRVLAGMSERAYSEAGLLEHIKHCWGAHELVPELGAWAFPGRPDNFNGA